MQQIAVRGVQFNQIEADAQCALGGFDELLFGVGKAAFAQGLRDVPPGAEWQCRWRNRLHAPSSTLSGLPPWNGVWVDPLRPACASWIPSRTTPYLRQNSTTCRSVFSLSSL